MVLQDVLVEIAEGHPESLEVAAVEICAAVASGRGNVKEEQGEVVEHQANESGVGAG